MEYRESSFPPPDEIIALHQLDPSYARDVFDMVKKQQQAEIDVKLIPIRAEAFALRAATVGVAFLPWVLIGASIVFAFRGQDVAAIISGAVGVLTGGAQIIHATRRPTPQPRPQAPVGSASQPAEQKPSKKKKS